MNKKRLILCLLISTLLLANCTSNTLIDTNDAVDANSWTYAKSAKAAFEIKTLSKRYDIHFKLRVTSAYRYSNLYVVLHLKGNGLHKTTRYQFKLAKLNGEWLGKGSGDIYAYTFPLLTDFSFAKPGKYEIEIEQNMRDNPLIGISDVGISLAETEPK